MRNTVIAILATGLTILVTGCREQAPMKWVDLRYLANDEYTLSAINPEPIRLQVKSTDPWEVFGNHPRWCTISPDSGGPDIITDVTVTYVDNIGLDERIDTLTIKSDYWIGKTIKVTQQGTAFLNTTYESEPIIDQEGGEWSFRISSNQDWRVEIDKEVKWAELKTAAAGSMNGTVNIVAQANKGEKRTAAINIYDRHNRLDKTLLLNQTGVQLDLSETLIKTNYEAKEYIVNVESNADWTVVKEDESITWFEFDKTSFSGNDSIVIRLKDNDGYTIRTSAFTVATVSDGDIIPVKKKVTLRQAYKPSPEHYEFNIEECSKWSVNQGTPVIKDDDVLWAPGRYLRYKFPCGDYRIRIKEWGSDAISTCYFTSGDKEIRWHMNAATGKTDISTRPTGKTLKNISWDNSVPHVFGLNMAPAEDGSVYFEWVLDDEVFESYTANGKDGGPQFVFGDTYAIFLGCSTGSVLYDWWEYSVPYALIDWGD